MKLRTAIGTGIAVVAALSSSTLLATNSASASNEPSTRVVAGGLDAPKYVTLGPDGVYVADSGRGGHRCVAGVAGVTLTRVCAGATGSIVQVSGHRVRTLKRGLASASVASTGGVSGVTAIAFVEGRMGVLVDDGGVGPTGVSGIASPFGARFGKLDQATRSGQLGIKADIAAFQATHPQSPAELGGLPGETLYDSDPHDMVPYRGGFAIADAAANDVVWVHASGKVTLLARLATRSETAPAGTLGPGSPATTIRAQAVPSSVAVGPDGALYVGLLRGVPSLKGTAEVDRVVPGQAPQPVVAGLTRVSDIAFDQRGRLDILESDIAGGGAQQKSNGALLRATLCGSNPVTATDLGVRGLYSPVGLAINKMGTAYITNNTTSVGKGELVAVTGLDG